MKGMQPLGKDDSWKPTEAGSQLLQGLPRVHGPTDTSPALQASVFDVGLLTSLTVRE
jgi:hypothetical protein